MAVQIATVNATRGVGPDSVPAKRGVDSVQWNGPPNRFTIHFLAVPSPVGVNDFSVPSGALQVQETATEGKNYYEVRNISSGVVMADPDVDVE